MISKKCGMTLKEIKDNIYIYIIDSTKFNNFDFLKIFFA
jgi:hypothetical protein